MVDMPTDGQRRQQQRPCPVRGVRGDGERSDGTGEGALYAVVVGGDAARGQMRAVGGIDVVALGQQPPDSQLEEFFL